MVLFLIFIFTYSIASHRLHLTTPLSKRYARSALPSRNRARCTETNQAFNLLSSHFTQTGFSSSPLVKNLPSSNCPPHSYIVIISIHTDLLTLKEKKKKKKKEKKRKEKRGWIQLTTQTKHSTCHSPPNAPTPPSTTGLLHPLHFPLNLPA